MKNVAARTTEGLSRGPGSPAPLKWQRGRLEPITLPSPSSPALEGTSLLIQPLARQETHHDKTPFTMWVCLQKGNMLFGSN